MKELEKDMKPRFIEDLGILRRGNNKGAYRYGLYECQYCGKEFEAQSSNIKHGLKSCGCLVGKNITHGLKSNRFYDTWYGMRGRCINPKDRGYKNYGGRGITVCEEWLDVVNFVAWAEKTHPNIEGLSLDRIDNDKGYSPENCTWSDKTTQAINQRRMKNNTSGYVGIYWNKASKKWDAKIGVNSKLVHIGTFPLIENAVQARDKYIIENGLPHKLSGLTKNIKEKGMAKYTRIASDRITEVVTNSYQEVVVELENIDLSFIFNLEPEEVAHNCDLQKVLDYLDEDFVRAYVAERFGVNM